MATILIDILKQKNRNNTITTGDFFHIVDSSDIDFRVQGIQEDNTLDPGTTDGYRYIVKDVSNLSSGFTGPSGDWGDNDILWFNGASGVYQVFLDASSEKQSGTIVFNEGDSKFYGFDGTEWLELGSGAVGVTGTTGATGATGFQGFQGFQGNQGFQGFQGFQGNIGKGVSYFSGEVYNPNDSISDPPPPETLILGITNGPTGTFTPPSGEIGNTGDYFFGTNNTLYYCYSGGSSPYLFAEVEGRDGSDGATGTTGFQGFQGNTGSAGFGIYAHARTDADGISGYSSGMSVSKTSTGVYRYIFTNSLPDTDYSVVGTPARSPGSDLNIFISDIGTTGFTLTVAEGDNSVTPDVPTDTKHSVVVASKGGGPAGLVNVYDIWLEQGNAGTEQDFLDTITGFQGNQGFQGFQGFQGNQGFQGFQGFQGVQGFQGFQGLRGSGSYFYGATAPSADAEGLTLGSKWFNTEVGGEFTYLSDPSDGFYWVMTNVFSATGPQGPAGSGSATVGGNNKSIQFNDNDSLSGVDSAQIVSNVNAANDSGISGNLVKYTESVTSFNYTSAINTSTELEVPFGSFNVYSVDDIKLDTNSTILTVTGFSNMNTGESMTLILGHTGVGGSKIEFPSNQNIWWSGGVIGGSGSTSTIYPTSTKTYDFIYFFDDGNRIFANYVLDFRQ